MFVSAQVLPKAGERRAILRPGTSTCPVAPSYMIVKQKSGRVTKGISDLKEKESLVKGTEKKSGEKLQNKEENRTKPKGRSVNAMRQKGSFFDKRL